jgi:hypothetical protein
LSVLIVWPVLWERHRTDPRTGVRAVPVISGERGSVQPGVTSRGRAMPARRPEAIVRAASACASPACKTAPRRAV